MCRLHLLTCRPRLFMSRRLLERPLQLLPKLLLEAPLDQSQRLLRGLTRQALDHVLNQVLDQVLKSVQQPPQQTVQRSTSSQLWHTRLASSTAQRWCSESCV